MRDGEQVNGVIGMSLRQRLLEITKTELQSRPSPAEPLAAHRQPDRRHSLQPEAELAELAVLSLQPGLTAYTWQDVIFFDSETTGLSTGSGTYLFLAGLAWYDSGELSVRQLFMNNPAREAEFLADVTALLEKKPVLVSFNGRSYDLPLLNSRLIMSGLPTHQPEFHLDLLYPSRRLWRKVLDSCALKSLERNCLGHERGYDIPGSEIPALYFDYLQRGDVTLLAPVFDHNYRDVVSLAELGSYIANLCTASGGGLSRAEEFGGLADAHSQQSDVAGAIAALECGLSMPGSRKYKKGLHQKLARAYAKQGHHEKALEQWRCLSELDALNPMPHVEMAKIYEHKLRAYNEASLAAKRALVVVERWQQMRIRAAEAEREAILHRLQRLERRQGKYYRPT